MARTRADDHDAQLERILQLAVEAFAREGYASASVAQVAAACGLSKAGLYHYYASKDAVLFAALDGYTRRLVALAVNTQSGPGTAQEILRRMLRAFLGEYRSSHAFHKSLLNDVDFLPPEQREQIRRQEREVVAAFARTIAAAYPQRAQTAQLMPVTMALLGMINFTFAWLRPDGPMTDQQFADLVIDLWENGLAGCGSMSGIPVRAARAA